jgi:hypothetical protein
VWNANKLTWGNLIAHINVVLYKFVYGEPGDGPIHPRGQNNVPGDFGHNWSKSGRFQVPPVTCCDLLKLFSINLN